MGIIYVGFLRTDRNYAWEHRNQAHAYYIVKAQYVLFLLDEFAVVGEQGV